MTRRRAGGIPNSQNDARILRCCGEIVSYAMSEQQLGNILANDGIRRRMIEVVTTV
jgi:hypothetical protein